MGYDTIPLSDIDLSRLKLVKEACHWIDGRDHSRWLFRTRAWNGGSRRRSGRHHLIT